MKRFIWMITAVAALLWANGPSLAQDLLPTSTPLPVIGATSTPVQVQIASITPPAPAVTPTATETGPSGGITGGSTAGDQRILIEPISEVNVRSSPEITEDNRVGSVRQGDRLVVLGQYFNWFEFQYDQVPSGRAWIYSDLVEVVQGDETLIPVIELNATPTEDTAVLAATETREAILAAPGGALTVTAESRIIQLPGDASASEDQNLDIPSLEATPLPTFTYPPNVSLRSADNELDPSLPSRPAASTIVETATEGGVPPIIPIFALGVVGLIGLLVSLMRG